MADRPSSSEARTSWIKSNQGVAVCLTATAVALLAYLLSSEWVYQKLRDGFRLGFFPVVAVVAILACTLTMIFDRHRHAVDEDVARTGWLDWIVAGATFVVCFVYFQLAWTLDFLLVSPVFLTGVMYLFGARPFRAAMTFALIMTVVIYLLFRLIGIELPTVIIPF